MRIKTLMLFAVISIILLVGCKHDRMNAPVQLSQELEKGFVTPPSSIQTSVYWYWISDNISKEGAVRDLHAMKKAGINRAFIGNIGIEDLPYGKVKMFSDEWWEIMHTALKTATELDIEIGIFNSPGWSQSGGPWIEPEQSMRYLASSETKVKGSRTVTLTLPKPNEDFQDVKVIAIPDVTREELTLTHKNAVIESEPQLPNLARLTDNDPETGVNLPGGNSVTISFKSKEPFTARSLTLQSTRSPLMAEAVLEAREGEKFNTVSKFVINRSNPALNVGFDPYAPVTIAIPATTSSEFRLQLNYHSSGSGVAEISLSGIPRMERYSEKTLAKMHPTPLPYWHDYLWPDQPEVDDNSLIIQESQIIDLTDKMSSDGVLNWDVPEGAWTILRMGMAPPASLTVRPLPRQPAWKWTR